MIKILFFNIFKQQRIYWKREKNNRTNTYDLPLKDVDDWALCIDEPKKVSQYWLKYVKIPVKNIFNTFYTTVVVVQTIFSFLGFFSRSK